MPAREAAGQEIILATETLAGIERYPETSTGRDLDALDILRNSARSPQRSTLDPGRRLAGLKSNAIGQAADLAEMCERKFMAGVSSK